jgi:hypothetical protein
MTMIVKLPDDAQVFGLHFQWDGRIVLAEKDGKTVFYYTVPGDKYAELIVVRSDELRNPNEPSKDIQLVNPSNNQAEHLYIFGQYAVFQGKLFMIMEREPSGPIDIIPAVNPIFIEYIFRLEDGRLILVDRPTYDWGYRDFRVFMGENGKFRQIVVNDVTRYKDGGTTIIETTEGTLFSPTPFDKSKEATWQDKVVTAIDRKTVNVTYVEGFLQEIGNPVGMMA